MKISKEKDNNVFESKIGGSLDYYSLRQLMAMLQNPTYINTTQICCFNTNPIKLITSL